MRYLRNKKDGFIYEWNEILAANALCEEVVKTRAKRKSKLDLATENIPEQLAFFSEELNADASRGL